MTVEQERQAAAVELCGVVQGLILTNTVPDYMKDFLASRCARVQRAFGMSPTLATAKIQEAANAPS